MAEQRPHQTSTVFWITYAMIIATTAGFILSSFIGMNDILEGIEAENSNQTSALVEQLNQSGSEHTELLVWAALEFDTLENRQNRADSLLSTRTWLRFMNTAFGSILIMCGAIFILSRVRIDEANIKAESSGFKLAFASTSPGIFMLAVGAVMTTVPLYASQTIKIGDGFSYPSPYAIAVTVPQAATTELTDEHRARMCNAAKADGIEDSHYCSLN
ncbi:MAG: hypothetical protein ABJO67_09615 [Pseudoruegeria sp.]